MSGPPPPCTSCPWRLDADATNIPAFDLALAEGLADTCGRPGDDRPLGTPLMACHHSREGDEVTCRGWLARVGIHHLGVRVAVAVTGQVEAEQLAPGADWPPTHETWGEVIEKLRRTDPGNGS